ncbi:MAG: hypothetical protein PHD06_03270 [Bacteroidales bacterium]|nr:hypothetical protein [Bacteroidales bacterium]MDD4384179.1 hypothetical protein [Bacteroidales bacterium]MDY0197805.1 hypothetical protein [Tenuifilaceae bacterium]
MNRFIRYILFFTLLQCCFYKTVEGQKISPDNLGNYWIIEGSRIFGVSESAMLKPAFSNIVLGNPSSVDASDPFKILAFYQNTQTIAIINNDAVLIGKPIELSLLNIGEVSCSARSSLGGVWLAVQSAHTIIRFDKHIKQIEQTIYLPNRFAKYDIIQIAEYNGELYIGFENGSVLIFDTYGALMYEYTFDPFSTFLLNSDRIFITKKDTVFEYSLSNNQELLSVYHCKSEAYIAVFQSKLACFNGKHFEVCEKIE